MDRLNSAIETNSFSVKNIVEFVKLSAKARLLHVSTCYVSESEVELVQEKPKLAPTHARTALPWKSESVLDLDKTFAYFNRAVAKIQSRHPAKEKQNAKLIELGYKIARKHGWYNVYTMTKWLGERLLVQEGRGIHATIVRPSIIEGSLFEPQPGWIEGLKVADPIFYAFGTQMFNQFPGDKDSVLDLIPVDMVSNALMLSLAELAAQEKPELKVYQSCSGGENPLTLGGLVPLLAIAFGRAYVPRRVYYPAKAFFAVFGPIEFLQKSALTLATWMRLKHATKMLEKGRRNMKRYMLLARLYAPYVSIRCRYDNSRLRELHARSAAEDRLLYPVSASHIDWEKYICHVHVPGLMNFVIKPQLSAQAPTQAKPVRKAQ